MKLRMFLLCGALAVSAAFVAGSPWPSRAFWGGGGGGAPAVRFFTLSFKS
jgi:hypothetical protein